MKKSVLLIILSLLLTMSCASNRIFTVYYVPLDVDYYAPPSRELLMKDGIKFIIESEIISGIFKDVRGQNGISIEPDTTSEDYKNVKKKFGYELRSFELALLRTILVDNDNNEELFITQEKVVLSLSKMKKYDINKDVIDILVEELERLRVENGIRFPKLSRADTTAIRGIIK